LWEYILKQGKRRNTVDKNPQVELALKRKMLAEYGGALSPQKQGELKTEIAMLESLVGSVAPAPTQAAAPAPAPAAEPAAATEEGEDIIDTEVRALVEDGWYPATVLAGDSLKRVTASTGTKGYQVVFKLDSGQTLPQTFYDQIDPPDINPILKRLFDAAGLVDPQTRRFKGRIVDLAGARVDIKVSIEHDPSGQYPPKNRVTGFRKVRKEVL
jgi:hypothetical protein